jgi:predicted Zn finger-like uncharacterized protein
MILVCENCNAQFVVNAAKLGQAGRTVRCGSCGHSWHQHPPDDMPAMAGPGGLDALGSLPDDMPEPEGEAGPGLIQRLRAKLPAIRLPSIPFLDKIPFLKRWAAAPASEDEPAAPPPVPKRRMPAAMRSQGGAGKVSWIMFGLVMLALPGIGFFAREAIVDSWPPAGKFYDAVHLHVEVPGAGLQLRNVTSDRRQVGGLTILVIEGEIVNLSKVPREIPMLRGGLRDANREELQHWLFSTGNQKLTPQEAIRFKAEYPDPPAETADITLYFVRGG